MSWLRPLLLRLPDFSSSLVLPVVDVSRRYRRLRQAFSGTNRRLAVPHGGRILEIQAIRSPEELAAFAPEWNDLYAAADCRLPFLHFDWIDQWWRAFGQSRSFVRKSLVILVARDHGRAVGILPLFHTSFGTINALRVRYVRPLGSDANLTEVRTVLALPGHEADFLAAAEEFFSRHSQDWDILNWGSFPEPLEPGSNVPGHWFSDDRHEPVEMFHLALPSSWDEFTAGLKRNTKEAIRRAHNALKRDGRVVNFRVLDRSADILPLLPRFFELHGERANLTGAVPHPDVFKATRHKRFLSGLTSVMADGGPLKLFVLEVDGAIVAMRLGFRIGGTLYCYYSGFDPVFANYSVMTRLLVEMLRWGIRQGLSRVNLSTGRDQSKLRWNPDIQRFFTRSQIEARFRARLAFALFARP